MNVFISGGAKNGKSLFAQELAAGLAKKDGLPLYYVATMIAGDDEDRLRIKRHIEDRDGLGFITIEEPYRTVPLAQMYEGVFLLDSCTALLANNMFRDGEYFEDAAEDTAKDLVSFARASGNVVFVSDFIYSEALRPEEYTENYRMGLALCDRALAEICDEVYEVICKIPRRVK